MLIVAFLRPEERLKMKIVHRNFRNEHVPNADKEFPLSYIIEMGGQRESLFKSTTVDLMSKSISKIEGLNDASIFVE